jgi:hypothetical protein
MSAATRHRTLKAGTIEFNGGGLSCMVRNMSSSGAALDVISPVGIPERFTLVVLADGRHLPCHVVWRKEKRAALAAGDRNRLADDREMLGVD